MKNVLIELKNPKTQGENWMNLKKCYLSAHLGTAPSFHLQSLRQISSQFKNKLNAVNLCK